MATRLVYITNTGRSVIGGHNKKQYLISADAKRPGGGSRRRCDRQTIRVVQTADTHREEAEEGRSHFGG